MKKAVVLSVLAAFAVTGCQATKSVVTEYDAEGKVVKVTETGESVVKTLADAQTGKTVVVWESGWAAYLSTSTATLEDPTPTVKMFAGKTDRGMVSAMPEQQDWAGIAGAINATKYDLSVTATGIEGKANK